MSLNENQKNKLEQNTNRIPDPKEVEENSQLSDDYIDEIDVQLKGFGPVKIEETCPSDTQNWGDASTIYSYIFKGQLSQEDHAKSGNPCDPWIHTTAKIDSLRILTDIQGPDGTGAFGVNSTNVTFSDDITVTGVIYADVTGNVTGDLTGDVTGTISGNAGTATALETARTIGGVSFDGTANINLPGVNASGNQDTSGSAGGLTASADISTDTTDDPTSNKEIVFNYVNDTTLKIKMRGADGTVRSVDLTLA
jgi:hypothetical protein